MKYTNPSKYDKAINAKVDKTLGYVYFIDSEHPLANKSGKVYYHRHIASIKLGKWIDKSYHVHHIDSNRQNNSPDNLEIVSPKMHIRKHFKSGNFSKKVRMCPLCQKKFITLDDDFCSLSCATAFRNKKGIQNKFTREELELLVWEIPTIQIAKKYGCSDVMIAKICKKWGIKKPSLGYWAKKNSNKSQPNQ